MSLIFDPDPQKFFLRENFQQGLVLGSLFGVADWLNSDFQGWGYYAGVVAGSTVLATYGPGAQATLYAAGTALDFFVFKSPEGSTIDVFLDGFSSTRIETYAANSVWEAVSIPLVEGVLKRIDLRHTGPSPGNTEGVSVMAFAGPFTLQGTNPQIKQRTSNMALVNIISFSIRDDDGDVASIPVYVDTGLTVVEYQLLVTNLAPLIDAVIGGVIDAATLTLNMSLPAGLKAAPTQYSETQIGGNFTFTAANSRYTHSIRIPAIDPAKLSGKSVNLADTDVAALVTGLENGSGPAIPRDRQGNDLVAVTAATKTFRRK